MSSNSKSRKEKKNALVWKEFPLPSPSFLNFGQETGNPGYPEKTAAAAIHAIGRPWQTYLNMREAEILEEP